MASKTYVLPDELRGLSDDDWLELISRGDAVPGLPQQTAMPAGISTQQVLQQAAVFYRTVKAYCDALAMPLGPHRRVLDFGAGWGCFSCFFVRDVDADRLYSCDFDPALLDLGRASGSVATLDRLYPGGRLPYPDNMFDCMIAYDAFAHLPPAAHLHWMRELARVAAPGCVFTFSVEPRRYLEGTAIPGATELLAAFDRGDIAYVPADPRDAGAQGHAVVPTGFIRRHWNPPFGIRDAIDEAHRFSKAVVIVQHA